MAEGWQHSTVAHVPMAFCTPGSTLLGVVSQLARVHDGQGGRSLAVLSHNRGLDVPDVENVFVDHTEHCPREHFDRRQTAVDVIAAALGRRRPFFGRLHDPSIAAVRVSGAETVILYEGHYAAASLPAWAALRPEVTVILYVHNPLSRTYGRRELRRMAEQCDAMVFCADHLRLDAQRRMPDVRLPLVTVHNGIDPAFLRQISGGPSRGPDTSGGRAARGRDDRPDASPHDEGSQHEGSQHEGSHREGLHDEGSHVDDRAGGDEIEDRDEGREVEVLFLGRIAAHKGPQHLIEALGLAQQLTDRRLRGTIVGSANYGLDAELTPFERELRDLASGSPVPIDFVANVDRAESVRLMRRANLLCLPSTWSEGLPLTALEGLTTGLPIVAFDAAGIIEACGDTALYAPIGDTAALAARIAECVNDPESTARRVAAGRERAAGFSWERAWSQFGTLIAGARPLP